MSTYTGIAVTVITYLLLNFPIRKYIFQRNIEFAQVILAESVVVPANALEQRDADNRHFKGHIPFWVQCLEYGRRGLSGFP